MRACAPAQSACNWLMRRLNRRSVVIIAMTLLMGLSVLIILYEVRFLYYVLCAVGVAMLTVPIPFTASVNLEKVVCHIDISSHNLFTAVSRLPTTCLLQ